MGKLEHDFFQQFALSTMGWWDRLHELEQSVYGSLIVSTKNLWHRINDLTVMSYQQFVHHNKVEAQLQNKLIAVTSRAALKEATMATEIANYVERNNLLEMSFFTQLATSTNGWWQRVDELSEMSAKQLVHHTLAEADLQNELITLSASSTLNEATLNTEIINYSERISSLEMQFFSNFAVTNNDLHSRINQLHLNSLVSMTNATNHWWQRIEELSEMSAKQLVHHTLAEADLQNELITLSASSALKEATLNTEIINYSERICSLEMQFYSNFAVTNNDLHRRIDQLHLNSLMAVTIATKHWWQRMDELSEMSARQLAHHTRAEANLQNELIDSIVRSSVTRMEEVRRREWSEAKMPWLLLCYIILAIIP